MGLLDLANEGQQVRLTVVLHANGALSVEGPVHDKAFCIAMLNNAVDAVRNHRKPGLVVPAHDVSVPPEKAYGAS